LIHFLENQHKRSSIGEVPQDSRDGRPSETLSHDCQICSWIGHLLADFHHVNPGLQDALKDCAFDKILFSDSQEYSITDNYRKIASEKSHVSSLIFGFVELEVSNVTGFVVGNKSRFDGIKGVNKEVGAGSE
jgi:hypothetical protein